MVVGKILTQLLVRTCPEHMTWRHQISSHGGSRLQEAQRMGRILRKSSRSRSSDTFDSYFYTLLSMDTIEMLYSEKRRRYLVAQGYEYHVRWRSFVPAAIPAADSRLLVLHSGGTVCL